MDIFRMAGEAFPEMRLPEYGREDAKRAEDIYRGEPPWRYVKRAGLYARGERRMSMLGIARAVAAELSAMMFAERPVIRADDRAYSDYITRALEENGFFSQAPRLTADALGTGRGVFKLYIEGSRPKIDFVGADRFIPCGRNGDRIEDGIFCSERFIRGEYYRLFERLYTEGGRAAAELRLFRSGQIASLGRRAELSELYGALPERVVYEGAAEPMFVCFEPNGGKAFFDGAEDTLRAIDIAFDSFVREFILGRKRIIVPSACIRTVVDPESGELRKYFDADDEAFMALRAEENEELKITDNTVELRVDEHIKAINALLGLLCYQVGLSPSAASFSARGIKTAAEVMSEDSRTARTIRLYKRIMSEATERVCRRIAELGVMLGELPKRDFRIDIGWRDGVIVDDESRIDSNIRLVEAGLRSKESAVADINGIDESAAREIVREAKEEIR